MWINNEATCRWSFNIEGEKIYAKAISMRESIYLLADSWEKFEPVDAGSSRFNFS